MPMMRLVDMLQYKAISDDVGLTRALVEHGKQYHCLYLDSLFSCRMYTSFSEIGGMDQKSVCRLVVFIPD